MSLKTLRQLRSSRDCKSNRERGRENKLIVSSISGNRRCKFFTSTLLASSCRNYRVGCWILPFGHHRERVNSRRTIRSSYFLYIQDIIKIDKQQKNILSLHIMTDDVIDQRGNLFSTCRCGTDITQRQHARNSIDRMSRHHLCPVDTNTHVHLFLICLWCDWQIPAGNWWSTAVDYIRSSSSDPSTPPRYETVKKSARMCSSTAKPSLSGLLHQF